MKIKRFLLLPAFIILALSSSTCKKSNSPGPAAKAVTPYIYGTMMIIVPDHPDSLTNDTEVYAYFYNDSIHQALVSAGTVILNGDTLYNAGLSYQGVYKKNNSGSINWSVQGSAYAPAINYTSSDSFPDYTASIPDTFLIINGMNLDASRSVTNNADSVIFKLYNPANGNTAVIDSANAPNVIFTSTFLDYVIGGQIKTDQQDLITLTISTMKINYRIINGKISMSLT